MLGLAGAAVLLTLTAGPAAAHNSLVSSAPSDRATVPRTPDRIILTFDEPAIAMGTQLVVTGPGGPVQQGPPVLVDNTVSQPLRPGSPAGSYTVDWRVTSADGHPISGSYAFTAEAVGAGTPGPSPDSGTPETTEPARPPVALWVLASSAGLLTAGAIGWRIRRTRASSASSGS